jgi:hypothetical protein
MRPAEEFGRPRILMKHPDRRTVMHGIFAEIHETGWVTLGALSAVSLMSLVVVFKEEIADCIRAVGESIRRRRWSIRVALGAPTSVEASAGDSLREPVGGAIDLD